MSWQTNSVIITLRNVAREMGLTRLIGRTLQGNSYEKAFDDALLASIRTGDVIWDIGANIGYYTRKFAEATGADGKVFAFEPFPTTVSRLIGEVGELANVTVHPIALGSEEGTMQMQAGDDSLGATSRIFEGGTSVAPTDVEITTGDSLLRRGVAIAPMVIKIDTEGYELDVLNGMSALLCANGLRAVFIEVHFGLLSQRGMANAPGQIERLLAARGFSVRWVDSSHIAALRG